MAFANPWSSDRRDWRASPVPPATQDEEWGRVEVRADEIGPLAERADEAGAAVVYSCRLRADQRGERDSGHSQNLWG